MQTTLIRRPLPTDPEYLKLAFYDIGTHEGVGRTNNPKVLAYYRDAGHPEVKNDAVAWCAAAVNAWLARAGYPKTGSLAAISFEKYGKPVDIHRAVRGDICVFNLEHSSWHRHVTLFLALDGAYVWCLGGNQSDAVCIKRFPLRDLTTVRSPMRFNMFVGNSGTTKKLGLIGAGTAAVAGGVGDPSSSSGVGEMINQLGYQLMSMQAHAWMGLVGAIAVVAGIWFVWRERKGWNEESGF